MPSNLASARPIRSLGLLLSAALLPLVVLGATLGAMTVQQQRSAIEREALDRTEALAVLLDHRLNADLTAVNVIAQTPALDNPEPNLDRLTVLGARILAGQNLWRALSISTVDGQRIFDVPPPPGGKLGPVIERPSHRRAVETRRPVFGNILMGTSGRYAFALRAPVVRGGRVLYVVSAVVSPETLSALLLARNLPAGWNATILDGNGKVVASTEERVAIGRPDPASWAEESGALREGRGPDGEEIVAAMRRLPNTGWSVRVTLPRSLYQAPLIRSLQIIALGSLLTLLLAGCFLWLFFRDARQRAAAEAALAQGQRLEALGRMTGGVAHDFNNLLTPVLGALDVLRRRNQNDERSVRLIDGALASAERARILVARLLTFARRQALDTRDVSIARLLNGMVDLLQRSVGPSINLVVNAPPESVSARVDPGQLELALLNLAVNARDAMPAGGFFTITAAEEIVSTGHPTGIAPGRYIRISAADTGEGMDPAVLKQAIEPFFSTKELGRGTGLGLSMVHGLAAQSGGGLLIASEIGTGTRVELWFPAGEAAADQEEEGGVQEVPEVTPMRILLVDDEELVRAATAEMLMEAGHDVDQAGSGAEGLKLLDAGPAYDLVVTDYAMPVMSGAVFIARLREGRAPPPVLLITGYAGAASDVPDNVPRLKKPFRGAELHARIAEIQTMMSNVVTFPDTPRRQL